MWPAIAGVLFVVVVVLGAYLWLQPVVSQQPATVIYEDDSVGWWPWIPSRHPYRPHYFPHRTPHHWVGPGGWSRPHRLGPGGMASPHSGGH
jgi:hypothetical protein